MSTNFNEKNYSSKMDKSIQSFKKDISTLRTGRANTNMLYTIKVDVYGQLMPVDQLATVSVPEARLISIQVCCLWAPSGAAMRVTRSTVHSEQWIRYFELLHFGVSRSASS